MSARAVGLSCLGVVGVVVLIGVVGAELGAAEDQIDTVELAPGENVTGKGTFTPKRVTYTDGLIGKGVRTDVS
ncbi:hypothetical protein OG982_29215 [Streptomyces sp. NBC_01551]|uniref:hypothetical protein n=1 Tax=Streptomyces sp. NBC_01551 TaxID=2975876 RepID=UPI00225C1D00|nr:hypothetical protein [Streptomyces sp. NBC_01551]MCX4529727.1 hypothetical protein [Streptomyces sp. NBC_01551]